MRQPWRLTGIIALALAAAVPGWTAPSAAAEEPAPLTRTLRLEPGWNLVGWTGPDTAVDASGLGAAAAAAYVYRAGTGRFAAYDRSLPPALQDLDALAAAAALWVFVPDATGGTWEQPAAIRAARTVRLEPGFNLVVWTGPNGMRPADAFAGLGDALIGAHAFAAPLRAFHSFAPDLPAALNTLGLLHYGDAVWLHVRHAVDWAQPSPLQFRCNPFPDQSGGGGGAWQAATVGRLVLEYAAGSTAAAYVDAVAAAAEADLRAVEARLRTAAAGPISLRLHPSTAALTAATGAEFGAITFPAQRRVHVVCGTGSAGQVVDLSGLRHELAHVVSVEAYGPTAFLLAEGLAGWADGRIGVQSLEAWAERARTLQLPSLRDLLTEAGYFSTEPVLNAFVASTLAVRYLIEQRGGLEPFWRLWTAAAFTTSDVVPYQVYGQTWRQLDAAYRAFYGLPGG